MCQIMQYGLLWLVVCLCLVDRNLVILEMLMMQGIAWMAVSWMELASLLSFQRG